MERQKYDIFTDKSIYPHRGPVLQHFSGTYDSCFVAFMPFVRIPPEAVSDREEYSYPEDDEILTKGTPLSWEQIADGAGLEGPAEINRALKTFIGALREVYRRDDLRDKLESYLETEYIWPATEGMFDVLSKRSIYKTLVSLGKKDVVINGDFFDNEQLFDLSVTDETAFMEDITLGDKYIYSADRELLFAIEWDSFFFLIATNRPIMDKIITSGLFEGFPCDEKTIHLWDYHEGELERLEKLEKEMKKH